MPNLLFISVSDKEDIKKNQLVKELKNWGKEYKIEFGIKVMKLPKHPTNVLHISASDNNDKNYGDRIPAVFIHKEGYARICSAVNDEKNFCKDLNFELGKKYQATIQQLKKDGKYWYEIIVDGKSEFKIENKNPKSFENCKLYLSDPWHATFSSDLGMINDLKITVVETDVSGKYYF